MEKDRRYSIVKKLLDSGQLNRLKDIIDILPKTKLIRDLGIHHQTFEKCIGSPERFTLKQVYEVASLIESDEFETLLLFHNEYMVKKKLKSKGKKYNALKRKIGK